MSVNDVTVEPELSEEEQILRDRLIVRLAPFCIDIAPKQQGCAHFVIEYVDELLIERAKRWHR